MKHKILTRVLDLAGAAVTRRPWWVVATFVVLTVCSGFLAATRLELKTDQNDLISADLPYNRRYLKFISAIETEGRKRTNRSTSVKNRPKPRDRIPKSNIVGEKWPQLDGRKSRDKEVTMMTYRSNHMPTLTRMPMTNITGILVRTFLNQKSWGIMTLQLTMIQYAAA